MQNKNSRDFMTGYKVKNNEVFVSLGTGEVVRHSIVDKNRIKLEFEKQIRDLQNQKKEAQFKCKHKKFESYINAGIVIASLTTLGSLEPSIIPAISLGTVASANGVLYFVNRNKSKKYDAIAHDESINNLIYDLQTNQKNNDDENKITKTTDIKPKNHDVSKANVEDISYDEVTIKKAA